jgi:protein-tyrosine phosphatase
MIDIHSHLLPDIDDGSGSVAQSVAVLQAFVGQGVHEVILTPHVRASEIATDPDDPIERRGVAFVELCDAGLERPALHLGFEIMLDQPYPEEGFRDRRFSLAGSRYHLVEFPNAVVADFAGGVLAHMVDAGAIPIVAHPERYRCCSVETIMGWRNAGAKIQVDATTLTRPTGRGRRARELLAAGLADVLAADNHGDTRTLKTGVAYLADRGGANQARRLSEDNPRAMIEDREVVDVTPLELKGGLVERLRRMVE